MKFIRRTMLKAMGALVATSLFATASAQAGTVIKLATLAPEGSTWHKGLVRMGEEWKTATNGEVELKIYAGGVTGNETVMLRKMRIGQLHAAAITNLGLLEIDPSSQALNTPMLIMDYGELDYVMNAMKPEFEQRIEEKGYIVLAWSDAGWARLFSKTALTDPKDAGKLKIFTWEGDPGAVEMFKSAGFNPVVVAATDILPSLQSGLIDSFPTTPLGALAFQWFGLAPHMMDVPWAPLVGATVISKEAWESIPEQHRAKLREISRTTGNEMKETIRKQDDKAIEVMKKYGLEVHTPTPAQRVEWEKLAEATHPIMRDKVSGPESFDRVKGLVEEYRAKNK
ncbi:MAG: TRAP transporter substrate-binding protein DctP [Alphaproteobacteria bacterium]|nr:TRAP transporter substrate-binding protein DctP [Alphaproteobacteria bacterium]